MGTALSAGSPEVITSVEGASVPLSGIGVAGLGVLAIRQGCAQPDKSSISAVRTQIAGSSFVLYIGFRSFQIQARDGHGIFGRANAAKVSNMPCEVQWNLTRHRNVL